MTTQIEGVEVISMPRTCLTMMVTQITLHNGLHSLLVLYDKAPNCQIAQLGDLTSPAPATVMMEAVDPVAARSNQGRASRCARARSRRFTSSKPRDSARGEGAVVEELRRGAATAQPMTAPLSRHPTEPGDAMTSLVRDSGQLCNAGSRLNLAIHDETSPTEVTVCPLVGQPGEEENRHRRRVAAGQHVPDVVHSDG